MKNQSKSIDQKAAKVASLVINALVTIAGLAVVVYGIAIWAHHYTKFNWSLFTLVMSLTGIIGIFQSVNF